MIHPENTNNVNVFLQMTYKCYSKGLGVNKDVNLSIQRYIKESCKGRKRERYCPKIQKMGTQSACLHARM